MHIVLPSAAMPSRTTFTGALALRAAASAAKFAMEPPLVYRPNGIGGIAQHVLQPIDGDAFQLGGGGAGAPGGEIDVQRGLEHAADGRDGRAGGSDVTEESGVGVVAAVADDALVELVEKRREVNALLGQRFVREARGRLARWSGREQAGRARDS